MTQDNFKNITMQQMEALIALVEEGSFSRAAQKMLLTQPALTKNIKNIEETLGTKIVRRSTGGISINASGKILYDYARRIVKLRNEAREKIGKLADNSGGDIYIGASTIPATYILPRALSLFRKKHPDIRVHIQTADSEETLNMVLGNQIQIGFIGKKPLNNRIMEMRLWKDRLALVVGGNHPWRKKKVITLQEFLAEPFVIREKGSATRDVLESCFKNSQSVSISQLNICSEMGSSEAIKEAVIAGLGVSVISVHAITRELSQKLLAEVPFPGCNIERNLYLIYQRKLELTALHKLFIDFLKNYHPV
jgi:DNA-binding transcriptional LysR family regulator